MVRVTAWPGPAQLGSSNFLSFTTPRLPSPPACLDHMTQMTQNPAEGSEGREAVPSRRRAPGTNKSEEPASHASQESKLLGAGCSPKLSLHSSRFWGMECSGALLSVAQPQRPASAQRRGFLRGATAGGEMIHVRSSHTQTDCRSVIRQWG